MNKERLRKDVYEMVWAKLTQQLKMLIAIEEDPEDDKLDDIEALISVSKYYGTFSWVLSREGQELQIHALDNGNVTLVIDEQVHRTIVIKLNYENNSNEFLTTVENTIVDFIQIFYTGNWHILADYLSPAADGKTDWKDMIELSPWFCYIHKWIIACYKPSHYLSIFLLFFYIFHFSHHLF